MKKSDAILCAHFYCIPALCACISTLFKHFLCAFLLFPSTFLRAHFYCVQHCRRAFLLRCSTLCMHFCCVCMCLYVCVCMRLYVLYCMCLYVFVCVCMCFVCVCIFYVLMCLYVFVCVCMCLRSINSFFFTSISTVFQHFCLSQLDLPVCTIVQRTCAEKATCACDLISIAHWSY